MRSDNRSQLTTISHQKLTDEQVEAITQAMISGKKIEAIKIYREATGEGLKEAKEAIEAIQRSVADKHPELLKNKPSSGCMPLIVVGVSFLAFGAYQLIA